MGMDADCTLDDYGRQGRGRGGGGQRCSEWCFGGWDGLRCGACLGPVRCSPCFRPGVQFLPGCVQFPVECVQFPARCVHFSHRFPPNVSTRPAHVSTRSLDGDSRRPGLPGRSGSDFGGCAALGTRRASARRLGRLPRLPSSPFRDLLVTWGGARKTLTPGSSPPDRVPWIESRAGRGRLGQAPPAPTGRGGKSRRNFEDAGRCATVSQERGKRLSPRNIQGRKTTDHCGEWILIKVTHHLQSGRGSRRPE